MPNQLQDQNQKKQQNPQRNPQKQGQQYQEKDPDFTTKASQKPDERR